MTTGAPARRPAGSPAGGQFAPTAHAESDVDLDAGCPEAQEQVFSGRETEQAVDDMVTAALWSSVDYDSGEPLDTDYGPEDVAPETRDQMKADLEDFITENRGVIARVRQQHPSCDAGQVGRDFWLTRNGHGAGFWDRGYGEDGELLTKAAKTYGSFELYVGDDGLIHGS